MSTEFLLIFWRKGVRKRVLVAILITVMLKKIKLSIVNLTIVS